MSDQTIKIKLKTGLVGLDGKPKKQSIRLRNSDTCKNMTDKEFGDFTESKTVTELLTLTPTDTLGEALTHILANCIVADDNAKAAEVFSYITKISNCLGTNKAEWSLSKDELKKFQELLHTAKQNISAVVNGQVDAIIEQYYAEIVTKNTQK